MPVTDISEVRKRRQAKRTKNMIMRIFIILLICGAALVIVLTKNMWYPYLNGMLTTIPEAVIADTGSAELAEGKFPIHVEGGMGYQLRCMDNSLALLDESQFHVYSLDGKIMNERQHTFANPILDVSSSKALIYDEGGRDFSLESKYKNIYSKTTEDVIYLARLSSSDYAAVVTKSDKFLSMLRIYNSTGESVFTYYSYDSRIINVTFTDNSSGCVVTVLTAEGGQLWSKMIRFDFSDTEPKWTSDKIPALAFDVRFMRDGGIIMIGDTMSAGFTSEGVLTSQYTYSSPIKDYDFSNELTAIITSNVDTRKTEMIIINGSECNSTVSTVLKENTEKVFIENNQAYTLTDNGITVYSSSGVILKEIILEDDYENLCKNGKYIYLLGYDSINRIDYAG